MNDTVKPHDRFKNAALFLCGYLKYPEEKIEPGDEGSISVTFNSEGQAGQIAKTVTVLANTIPATKVLTISAEVLKK